MEKIAHLHHPKHIQLGTCLAPKASGISTNSTTQKLVGRLPIPFQP